MAEPMSPEDFQARYAIAYLVTGSGPIRTTHLPCPFCAAADWMVYSEAETKSAMTRDHACQACGRSARYEIGLDDDGVTAELVQTAGPDAPGWMIPPRRIDRGA